MSDDDRLAIEGGTPELPQGPPPWPKPLPAVREALAAAWGDGSWGRYHGPHGERLQAALQELTATQHSWLCASGTVAVELALRGLKVGAGDEVILAAYDFPGNFRAIEAVGARPVLVDLAPHSWSIDVAAVAEATSPQAKAIIVSHLHGSLADMPRLRQVADQNGLAIVEDVCQAPGAVMAHRPAGSWGDVGVFSFGGSKLLTAGRGGALVTNRPDIVQRLRVFCDRGNDAFPLSELQAAVLLPQFQHLADDNQRRRQNATRLQSASDSLDSHDCVSLIPLRLTHGLADQPVFYKLPWLLAAGAIDSDEIALAQVRREFIAAVRAEGVALDEGFRGFALRTTQRCRAIGALSRARQAAARTVLLHHPVLLESAETVCQTGRAMRKVASRLLTSPIVAGKP